MIYLNAYYSNNLGDDLFVRTILRRYPNEEFYACCNREYANFLFKEKNVKVIGKGKYFLIKLKGKLIGKHRIVFDKSKLKKAKAFVFIGGSVFIEFPEWERYFEIEPNPNKFILGANFGPYTSPEFLEKNAEKIRSYNDCCFRDSYSYNLFENKSNVRLAADILFACPALPEEKQGDCIGISVMDFTQRDGLKEFKEEYEAGIVKICDHWCEQGKKIKLFSFCTAEGDAAAAKRIQAACKAPEKIECINYDGDIDFILDRLNDCETIYSTRFHAMILGWALQKRVIPIIYSNKQTNVLSDIGYNGAVWDIKSGDAAGDSVIQAQAEPLGKERLAELKRSAEKQFAALDKFLK